MTAVHFLEAVTSLSLQVAVLIIAATLVVRRPLTGEQSERIWTTCLLCICAVVPGALALPHLRLLPVSWLDVVITATNTPAFRRLEMGVLLVWGAGAGIALLRLIAGWTRTGLFLKHRARPADLTNERLATVWHRESARTALPGRQKPLLLVSEEINGPFCWQLHQPLVVFLPDVLAFPAPELCLMMRHELVHLSRQHPIQLFLQKLVEIAFWFHPTVWHLSGEINKSRELACDQLAIQSPDEAAHYLRGLLRLAEYQQPGVSSLAGGLEFHRRKQNWIPERAAAIANRNWNEPPTSRVVGLQLLLVAVAVCLLPVLRIPVYVGTSRTAMFSPWPEWSAEALHALGIEVRDYEPDWYSTPQHEHHIPVMPDDYR